MVAGAHPIAIGEGQGHWPVPLMEREELFYNTERALGRKENTVQGVKKSLELKREKLVGKCGILWRKDWQE